MKKRADLALFFYSWHFGRYFGLYLFSLVDGSCLFCHKLLSCYVSLLQNSHLELILNFGLDIFLVRYFVTALTNGESVILSGSV